MRRVSLFILFILITIQIGPLVSAQEQDTSTVEITSLRAGEAIRGIVRIVGNTAVDGFVSWELTFSYTNDTTGTWFIIAEGDELIEDGTLTEWDTTTITDGNYKLRLTVFLEAGRRSHFVLPDIRVRNYTPIETDTSTPTLTPTPFSVTPQPSSSPTITQMPTNTPIPNTPTPLPTNPLVFSASKVSGSLVRGATGAMAFFVIIGLYGTIKKWFRRS